MVLMVLHFMLMFLQCMSLLLPPALIYCEATGTVKAPLTPSVRSFLSAAAAAAVLAQSSYLIWMCFAVGQFPSQEPQCPRSLVERTQ